MKILLIYPPVIFSKSSYLPNIHLPLGLLYIAASVEARRNDSVELYDTRLSAHLSQNNRLITLGDTWEEIERHIYEAKPDIVGISNLSFAQLRSMNKIAEIAKKIDKKILVVVGGQHPSACPEDLLVDQNIDAVIRGEGEEAFCQLLQKIRMGEPLESFNGVVTRINLNDAQKPQKQQCIFDLDTLPLPAYHLYDMGRYFYLQDRGFSSRFRKQGLRPISMITSRGCPFNCIFCLGHGVMGKRWRSHSIDSVMEHIKFLIKEYGIDLIHFEDDNINFDPRRFENLLSNLKSFKHRLSWDTPNGVRADNLDESLLCNIKKAGCDYLIIGVESGVQRILDEVIFKNLKLSAVIKAASLCKALKLRLFAFFVIGFPGEKIADMKKTIDFALNLFWKYDVISAIFWASPYKGTRLYEICSQKGYLTETICPESLINDHQLNGKMLIRTEDFTPQDVKKCLCEFRNKIKWLIFIKGLFSPKLAIEYLSILLRNPILIKDYLMGQNESAIN